MGTPGSIALQIVTFAPDGSATCEGWLIDNDIASEIRTVLGEPAYESASDSAGVTSIAAHGESRIVAMVNSGQD